VTPRNDPHWIRQAGLLTAIPFVLLMGPAVGYYLGTAIDTWRGISPWGMAGGVLLGLASSLRVVIQLVKQSQESDSSK